MWHLVAGPGTLVISVVRTVEVNCLLLLVATDLVVYLQALYGYQTPQASNHDLGTCSRASNARTGMFDFRSVHEALLWSASQVSPLILPQSDSQPRGQADEPRRRSVDNAELNQLARMMPDPAEDELIDDGTTLTCPL